MAKQVFNYCAIDWYENELQQLGVTLPEIVEKNGC